MPEDGRMTIEPDEPEPEEDDIELPDDPEELAEVINQLGREVLAEHAISAKRFLRELKRRNLKGESLRAVAYAAGISTEKVRDTRKALGELAPTRIIAEFNFGLPDADGNCPCCGRAWSADRPRDMSGFDVPT